MGEGDDARDDGPIGTHGGTAERIALSLRRSILTGELRPGERVRQEALAEQFGASRVPVREALRILEGEGLLTLVPNAGAWVARLSAAGCDEVYRIRESLEPLLLRTVAESLTDVRIDALDFLADAMEAHGDVERFLRLDREFHLSMLQGVDTLILGDHVRVLWNRTQHYRREAMRLFSLDGDDSVHHDHRLLVAALRRGDVDEAAQVLALHIRRSRLELAANPEVFALGSDDPVG